MINTNNEIWYAEQRDLAIEERDAALARAEAAEAERDALREQLARYDKNVVGLADIVGIQGQDGNWNYSRYMRGLANGLLLAQSIMNDGAVYEPFGEPDEYLHDDTTELAAREWRSVTDDWPPYDTPVLARATLVSPVFIAVRERPDNAEYAYVWTDSDGINFYPEEIGYCAAIPTPPQDDDR